MDYRSNTLNSNTANLVTPLVQYLDCPTKVSPLIQCYKCMVNPKMANLKELLIQNIWGTWFKVFFSELKAFKIYGCSSLQQSMRLSTQGSVNQSQPHPSVQGPGPGSPLYRAWRCPRTCSNLLTRKSESGRLAFDRNAILLLWCHCVSKF